MKNFTIRTRLMAGFSGIALIAAIIGIYGTLNLNQINKNDTLLYEQVTVGLGELALIAESFQEIRILYRDMIRESDVEKIQVLGKKLDEKLDKINEYNANYEKTISTQNGRDIYNNYLQSLEKVRPFMQKTVQLALANKDQEAWDLFPGEFIAAINGTHESIQMLLNHKIERGEGIITQNQSKATSTSSFMIILSILGVAIAILLGFITSKNIKGIIQQVVDETKHLVDAAISGKLAQRANVDKINREFQAIPIGFNQTLDAVVGILDVIPTPVMIIDVNHNIQYMNKTGAAIGGKRPEELENTKCFDFFKTTDCNTERCACRKSINNNVRCNAETTATPSGTTLDIAYSAVPLKDGSDKIIGALEVVTDQSEIKKAFRKSQKINDYQTKHASILTQSLNKFAKGDLNISLITDLADNDTSDSKQIFDQIFIAVQESIEALKLITDKAKLVASGDLTIQLEKRSEADELIHALSAMVTKLNEIVTQIVDAAENVATGSNEMNFTATQLAQGATEQASSSEEVSSSVEEMASTIQQNSENAIETEKIATTAAQGINDLSLASQKSLDAIRLISEKIRIINDIAEKTDILAINAAIEAARAGDHGKGFAVVAAEVRKLAEVSQKAALDINSLSASSLKITEETGAQMASLLPNIQKTARLVQEIAVASQEQSAGAEQIAKAVDQFSQVTQQNSAAAEEMSSSSEELSSQADMLREIVSFFNTGKTFKKSASSKNKVVQTYRAAGNGNGSGNGNGHGKFTTKGEKIVFNEFEAGPGKGYEQF
jgi:PAS domain S-box-containing protein